MAVSKDEILDAIGKMSVIEVVELIADMEKKFGVTAAAAVAVAAGPAAGAAAAAPAEEQTEFTVTLKEYPADKKVTVIKVVREITGPRASRKPRTWSRAYPRPSRKASPRPTSKRSRRSWRTRREGGGQVSLHASNAYRGGRAPDSRPARAVSRERRSFDAVPAALPRAPPYGFEHA